MVDNNLSQDHAKHGFWCLVYTKPRQERVAYKNLSNQFSEVYLPLLAVKKRANGVLRLVDTPMFSRYVFLYMRPDIDSFAPIRSTKGVSHLVTFGKKVARVPEEFISFLKQHESTRVEASSGLFKPGERVAIEAGPFEGYEAIFKCDRSENRAIILLDLATQHTALCISRDDLGTIE